MQYSNSIWDSFFILNLDLNAKREDNNEFHYNGDQLDGRAVSVIRHGLRIGRASLIMTEIMVISLIFHYFEIQLLLNKKL